MAVQYRLDVKSTAGVLQAVIGDYIGTVTYSKAVNEVGLLQFVLPADHAAVAYLTTNAQVEVWRRDTGNGVAWMRDFAGLVRTTQYSYPTDSPELFQVWCPSVLTMLSWRIVAFPADSAGTSKFTGTSAETVMSLLVKYNASVSATVANGREREGAIAGLSYEVDGAGGNIIDYACAHKNLLAALQEVAKISGGDFDVELTGASTWQYRWYAGQLGTDRSATVVFSLSRGNMATPTLTHSKADEATVAIVGGRGEAAARAIVVRTGTDYHITSANEEVFRDARDRTTTAGLNAAGDELLDTKRARPKLAFTLLQTPALVWNRDVFLGDKIAAQYRGYTATMKVAGVTVSFDKEGNEKLEHTLEEV